MCVCGVKERGREREREREREGERKREREKEKERKRESKCQQLVCEEQWKHTHEHIPSRTNTG